MKTTPLELVLSKLSDAKENSNGWSARCPAHNDRTPSLNVSLGDNGGALVHCHAGCTPEAVVSAMGLTMRDLMPTSTVPGDCKPKPNGTSKTIEKPKPKEKPKSNRKSHIVETYDYKDETGKLLFQVVRYDPKNFRQRRPKDGGGWDWSVKGVRVIPYRLPELLAEPTRPVFVPEGEKDRENLNGIGVLATCNAGGAGKWKPEHANYLRGRCVIVLADNDDAGRDHAQIVALSLHGLADEVRLLELPGLPPKGDTSDWIAAGGTRDELRELAKATPLWTPSAASKEEESTVPAVQPWSKIKSFEKLTEFPTHALPEALCDWVSAESHATQTPADLAGLLALTVLSAAIARRVEVEPRPGWREPVNLFTATLLEPGNRKSAVFSDATEPLREYEAELIKAARPAVAREQSERRQAEARLTKLETKAAAKGDPETRHEAGNLAEQLAEQIVPALPQLIVDDATNEKLGMILAEQGGRIASLSPEGGVFDLMKGLYSNSGIAQFGAYLMGHSGDDLVTDRVSRKKVRVRRPALTCGYAIQPQVIAGLADNVAFRARGLMARFLYAIPQSWIGSREIAPQPVSDAVREAYRQKIRALAELDGEHVLHLTADASAAFQEWETVIETMLDDGGIMEKIRDWGAKLAGLTLRLSAVLHCVENGPMVPISRETITAAVEIALYSIPHAEAVLSMTDEEEGPGDSDARYVLRWIERHSRRKFTQRDVHQHGRRRFPKVEDLIPVLQTLEQRGYIRSVPKEKPRPGRPSSPGFEVNPEFFANKNPEKCTQNTQNSIEQSENR